MIVDMGLSFFAPSSLSKNAGSFEARERERERGDDEMENRGQGGICRRDSIEREGVGP